MYTIPSLIGIAEGFGGMTSPPWDRTEDRLCSENRWGRRSIFMQQRGPPGPMTAYVDLAGELRAAFKSLRQRGPAGLRFRAAGREDVVTGTH